MSVESLHVGHVDSLPFTIPTPPATLRNGPVKMRGGMWRKREEVKPEILRGQDVPTSQKRNSSVVESLRQLLPAIQMPKWKHSSEVDRSVWRRSPRRVTEQPLEDASSDRLLRTGSSGPAKTLTIRDVVARTASVPVQAERRPSILSNESTTRGRSATSSPDVHMVELIPNKLYFTLHANEAATRQQIKERSDLYFFSCNLHESYIAFARDFGPVNLGTVYRFWRHVRAKARNPSLDGRPLVYYSDLDSGHIANAAFLLATFMVLEHGVSAEAAAACFDDMRPHVLVPFRDASVFDTGFRLSLRDCIDGLSKAVQIGWFAADTFNVDEYDRLEHPLSGDMSLIGDRFIAFRGPSDGGASCDDVSLSACFYANTLRAKGVAAVVRLNEPGTYFAEHFVERGIIHHDLFFADCSNPSAEIVESFLDICDEEPGLVGVHCKAGLGRTGTLIALWMMKHHGFSAREAIGWLRIVRPGSVIGQQQNFLVRCEKAGFQPGTNRLNPLVQDDAGVDAAVVAQKVSAHCTERAQVQLRLPTLHRK